MVGLAALASGARAEKVQLFLLPHTHADVGWLELPEALAREAEGSADGSGGSCETVNGAPGSTSFGGGGAQQKSIARRASG